MGDKRKRDKGIEEKVAECGIREAKESIWIRRESFLLNTTKM